MALCSFAPRFAFCTHSRVSSASAASRAAGWETNGRSVGDDSRAAANPGHCSRPLLHNPRSRDRAGLHCPTAFKSARCKRTGGGSPGSAPAGRWGLWSCCGSRARRPAGPGTAACPADKVPPKKSRERTAALGVSPHRLLGLAPRTARTGVGMSWLEQSPRTPSRGAERGGAGRGGHVG